MKYSIKDGHPDGPMLYHEQVPLGPPNQVERLFWRTLETTREELETARLALQELKTAALAIQSLWDAVGKTYGVSPVDVITICNKGLNPTK
jgi:hypothetical protein